MRDIDDPFQQLVAAKMTRERALRIRFLRVEEGCTWRSVGDTIWREWGEKGIGGYDIGYAMCAVASDVLGENWE